MYFLGKAFKVRGALHGDENKPFLDHLEDLRVMVTKIVITLLVTTVGCWIFHTQLIDIMSRPVHKVWEKKQEKKLPDSLTTDQWEEAKQVHATLQGLTDIQKAQFFLAHEDNLLEERVNVAGYFKAAVLLTDKDDRKKWAEGLEGVEDSERELLLDVIDKEPEADLNAKSKVVEMKSLKPTETFMLAFKLSFFAGLAISMPLNIWFVLQFVLPGLKEREKKVMWPAILSGGGLFLLGSTFAYFIVLPEALNFFFEFGTSMGVQNEWRIGEYISFVTQFTVIFGLAFELPVLIMALVKVGLLHYQVMSTTRLYALLGVTVLAAVITPTGDMLTLSMLVVPMYLLYEICIVLAFFDARKQRKKEEKEEKESGGRSHPELNSAIGAVTIGSSIEHDDEDFEYDEDDDHDHDCELDYDADAEHKEMGYIEDAHDDFEEDEGLYYPEEEEEEDDYDYEADHKEFGHHGGIDGEEEDQYDDEMFKHEEDKSDHDLDHLGLEEDPYDEHSAEEIKKIFGDETEEEAISESEGDEGDSDSYEENLDNQESDDDSSEDDKKD